MSYEGHIAGEIMQNQELGKSHLKFSDLKGPRANSIYWKKRILRPPLSGNSEPPLCL
jgi:hypothetical protein